MSALIEVDGVSKAFGGVQALADCRPRGRRGLDQRPDRPERLRQDDALQRDHRLRARRRGRGPLRRARRSPTRSPDRVFKLGIGRTFQLTRIFARLTVLENMLVATQRHEGWLRGVAARAPARRRSAAARSSCSSSSASRRSPREPAGNLSYGQRKLLELASLLVADPAVLLLDEPAGGVNPTLIKQLAARIRELNAAGKTFLVVEHNMEFVMSLCHQVTVLEPGLDADLGRARRRCAPTRACSTPTSAARASRSRRRDAASVRPHVAVTPAPGRAPRAERRGRSGAGAARDQRRRRRLRRRRHPQGRLLRRARGRDHLHRRAQRRRQVDAARHDQRPAAAATRARSACAASRSPASRRGQIVARGVSLVPQAHSLFPQMTVQENVEMGAFTIRDRGARRRAARGRGRAVPDRRASARGRRPAASRAASSASSSSRAA